MQLELDSQQLSHRVEVRRGEAGMGGGLSHYPVHRAAG